jgi:predicted dehydrogenase
MRAVIGNEVVELADHHDQPGLVLVQVETSARAVWPALEEPRGQQTYRSLQAHAELLRNRVVRFSTIALRDGSAAALEQTRGVLRRGRPPTLRLECATFTGRVRQGDGWAPGARVAGVSPTHPSDTELVLTRPELLVPVPDAVPSNLAAVVLYGSMAMYAAATARRQTTGPVGVLGSNAVAYLAASALLAEGVPLALQPGESPEISRLQPPDGLSGSGPPPSAEVWIDSRAPGAAVVSRPASGVIGLQISEAEVARRWPQAERRYAADVDDMLRDPNRIVDLFYDDGPVDWPEWMNERYRRAFISLAAEGRAVTGHPLTTTEVRTSHTPEGLAAAVAAARAGSGIMLTSFPPDSRRVRRRLVVCAAPSAAARGISVIGAGDWTRGALLESILRRDDVTLRGFCDRRPEALHLARHTLPFQYATTHYEELLSDDDTDLIVVATYHGYHSALATQALEAGKHCFVEKPPVVDSEQLRDLFAAAKSSDRFLYVGFNRRFAPATERLVRHLRASPGPTMVDIVVHGIPLPPNHWYYWPSNGNRIISNVCHFIDYTLHLTLGERPVRISACPTELGRADRQITITMAFAEGSTAAITYSNRGSDRGSIYFQSYQVMKEDLTARIDDFKRLDVWRAGKRVERWHGQLDLGHHRQMAVVADALANQGASPVPLVTAELTARVVLAAARAAEQQTTIELDLEVPALTPGSLRSGQSRLPRKG